jgi:hypothetical protein
VAEIETLSTAIGRARAPRVRVLKDADITPSKDTAALLQRLLQTIQQTARSSTRYQFAINRIEDRCRLTAQSGLRPLCDFGRYALLPQAPSERGLQFVRQVGLAADGRAYLAFARHAQGAYAGRFAP